MMNLFAIVMVVSMVIGLGCSDRFWGERRWLRTRMVLVHVMGPVCAFALVAIFFLALIHHKG